MAKKVTKRQAQSEVNKYADGVSADDVSATIGKEDKFRLLFRSVDVLTRYWDDIRLVFAMLKDFSTGKYTKCPWRTIALLVGVLAYVLAPLDLIPDFVPAIGWSDDCLALASALAMVKVDLDAYKAWRNSSRHVWTNASGI